MNPIVIPKIVKGPVITVPSDAFLLNCTSMYLVRKVMYPEDPSMKNIPAITLYISNLFLRRRIRAVGRSNRGESGKE